MTSDAAIGITGAGVTAACVECMAAVGVDPAYAPFAAIVFVGILSPMVGRISDALTDWIKGRLARRREK